MISQIAWKIEIRLILVLFVLAAFPCRLMAAEAAWPRKVDFDLGVMQLYEPQIVKFEGNRVAALAAVAITMGPPGAAPVFAAISFSAISASPPNASRLVIHDIELTGLHFGEGVEQNPNDLLAALTQELEDLTLTIDRPHRIAAKEDQINIGHRIKSQPINILFRTVPSVLVALDGEPRLQQIENSDLAWVINASFPMLYQPGAQQGSYYLLIARNQWYQSTSPFGHWTQVSYLPSKIRNLFNQAEANASGADVSPVENPDIIVTSEPTELLVAEGVPAWAPLAGMQLLYMTNTDSDIFLDLQSGRRYVLLQGRWYSGLLDRTGSSWLPVGNDELPAPFADIDVNSPKSHVLAFVHGTPQARTALLENALPQARAVPRNDTSFQAEWDGEPRFETVAETSGLEYAINTPDAVFRVENRYYACEEGVWYESTSAFGPWWIAVEVPDIIYAIPASNPQYRVTYARIYAVTPDLVYAGYTPGYLHNYPYRGAVVFGSGWRYQPWFGSRYYSRPWGWGFQPYYDPWLVWGYVNPVFRPHYYQHNRHHYRNIWYQQKRRHGHAHRHSDEYRNHNGRVNEDGKGHKSGRHRTSENHDNRQTAAIDPSRRAGSNTTGRMGTQRSHARSEEARSTTATTATSRAQQRVGHSVTQPNKYTSRPRNNRSERPLISLSERQSVATYSQVNSRQHRSNAVSAIRAADRTHRTAATGNRARSTRNRTVAQSSVNNRTTKPVHDTDSGQTRQIDTGPSRRSHDRGNRFRNSTKGQRKYNRH